jgi:methyl-accepting chemotaxis protein
MKFKDFKIRRKINIGFMAIAAIALIVGIVGLIGLRNVGGSFNEVAEVRMPSVQYLLEIESGIERVMVATRTILNPNLTVEQRAEQKKIIEEARASYAKSMAEFEKLPMTSEEEVLWNQFKEGLQVLRQSNQKFDAEVEKLNEIDIHYPMEFL